MTIDYLNLPKNYNGLIPFSGLQLPLEVLRKLEEIRDGRPINRIIVRILEQALDLEPHDFDWHYKEMRRNAIKRIAEKKRKQKEQDKELTEFISGTTKKVDIKKLNI